MCVLIKDTGINCYDFTSQYRFKEAMVKINVIIKSNGWMVEFRTCWSFISSSESKVVGPGCYTKIYDICYGWSDPKSLGAGLTKDVDSTIGCKGHSSSFKWRSDFTKYSVVLWTVCENSEEHFCTHKV